MVRLATDSSLLQPALNQWTTTRPLTIGTEWPSCRFGSRISVTVSSVQTERLFHQNWRPTPQSICSILNYAEAYLLSTTRTSFTTESLVSCWCGNRVIKNKTEKTIFLSRLVAFLHLIFVPTSKVTVSVLRSTHSTRRPQIRITPVFVLLASWNAMAIAALKDCSILAPANLVHLWRCLGLISFTEILN